MTSDLEEASPLLVDASTTEAETRRPTNTPAVCLLRSFSFQGGAEFRTCDSGFPRTSCAFTSC